MIAAFVASCLFLISYIVYHARDRIAAFPWPRTHRVDLPFTILITHVVLAAVIVPLVLVTLRRGLHRDDARHRAIARWTWPLWLYVSVTGVIIYGMLYHLY